MSTTVDSKVLEMRFDNRQFESNVQTSLSTIDKLKRSLNFKGMSKGLEDVGNAAKKTDISSMGNALESVQAKFSALQVIGVTALANITNSAIDAGKKIASALTIDPIKSGFQEYETQINAVQTILANTESKGTTLSQVNAALDELNTYADKTIYNFTEMTRNIGTFTAAGVDLDKSVTAIKGIANLAAVSGSTSQQASTAMYQLSQALATGTVKLQDWNSVVNAGMGGEVFQNALKRTAEQMGYNVDQMIEKYGSFRESLTRGEWLTTEVLTETLTQLSGAYSEADLIAQGYSKKQAKEIAQLAETAVNAATKVKTFTQLWDTLKEAAQSGWTQTWEIIVGDFGEAKELLTEISDTIGGIIGDWANSRNALLSGGLSSGWKQLLNAGIADEAGYADAIQEVARKNGDAFDKMVKDSETFADALKSGLSDGTITSDMLTKAVENLQKKMSGMSKKELDAAGYTKEMVEQIETLVSGLKDGSVSMDEFVDKMSRTSGRENLIQALWNSCKGLMSVITPIKEAFREVFPPATGEQLYSLTEKIRDFTVGLEISGDTADKLKTTFKGLFSILDIGKRAATAVIKPVDKMLTGGSVSSIGNSLLSITASIGDFFIKLNEVTKVGNAFSTVSGVISCALDGISYAASAVVSGVENLVNAMSGIDAEVPGIEKIFDAISKAISWVRDNISAGDIFAGLAGSGIFLFAKKLSGVAEKFGEFIDKIKGLFDAGKKSTTKFKDILGSLNESLKTFQQGIKVASLVGIAVAITMLSSALRTISEIKPDKIAYSLFTIGVLIKELNGGFGSIVKSLSKFKSKGVIQASIAMMAMAKAVDILASAMIKLKDLSMEQIAKGLVAIGGSIFELTAGIKGIGSSGVSLKTSVAVVALAKACQMLTGAFIIFGKMTWEEIKRGLAAMGGALAELSVVAISLRKFGGGSVSGAASVLILSKSLDEISENLKRLGTMKWEEIKRGLTAMGGALAEFTAVLSVLSKVGGFGAVLGGGAIYISVQSLNGISENLERLGTMTWEEIKRSLATMGGALSELAIVCGVLSKLTGLSGLFGAGTLVLAVHSLGDLADALVVFGGMAWDKITRGLYGMGLALTEVAVVSGVLGKLTGLSGLLGAGTIVLGVQSLGDLADAFEKFGGMSWDEIKKGLVGMGGALTEVATVSGLLGSLTGVAGLLGAGTLVLAVQSLGDLADAFKKFGGMSWDEIKKGLASMGSAMGEVGLGGFLNTLSGLGALTISAIAKPLGDLADSVKKWNGVTVPDELSSHLFALSKGIMSFTLGGLGAGALSIAAPGLSQMADTIKKWNGVTVPDELASHLSALSKGIMSFTLGGLGAGALSTAAPGLSQMADAVKKWVGISIPKTLREDLIGLADGVKAFSFAFMGGWSLSALNEPLGKLANSVNKWKGIKVPDTLKDDLKKLASGIKAFSLAFAAGWSLDTIVEPLGKMAVSVKKWKGVEIPDTLKDGLEKLAEGVEAFNGVTTSSFSAVVSALKSLRDSVKGISTTDIANVLSFISLVKQLGNISIDTSSLSDSVSAISSMSSTITSLIRSMMISMQTAISSKKSGISSAMNSVMSGAKKSVTSNSKGITKAVTSMMKEIVKSISSKKKDIETSFTTAMTRAKSAIRDLRPSFYSAGVYLGEGLESGIRSKKPDAYDAGYELGKAAVRGEKDGQKSKSPSKLTMQAGKWLGEGLIIGMKAIQSKVYNSGNKMGNAVTDSISAAVQTVSDILDSGESMDPTIRPVLDLSGVESEAGRLNGILNLGSTIGVSANAMSVNSIMGRKNQNGELLSAIKGLRDDISSGNSGVNVNVQLDYNAGADANEIANDIAVNLRRAIRRGV